LSLKEGYTTGTHLCACIKGLFVSDNRVDVILPNSNIASINIVKENNTCYSIKGDNDDIDVTKGCKIISTMVSNIDKDILNPQQHKPSIINIKDTTIYLYAGHGVGVVTKKGLKIEPNYPAINPTPLKMIQNNLSNLDSSEYHIVVSVENGQKIAKETANAKVGVIGGISILGTTGIVKPVSASAYIDSVREEISVISTYNQKIVFTLGNSAYEYAKNNYNRDAIVEIGNFIYDSLEVLKDFSNIKNVVFVTSIAKMVKVAQGFKNTHNRYGDIDFVSLVNLIEESLNIDLDEEYATVKAIKDSLDKENQKRFKNLIEIKAEKKMREYADILSVDVDIETIVVAAKKGV
jgi:cobalt-precorrin-5B (C1)-methyltransferase